jgi:uncharacterized protein YyaL (SSP411 family)
MKNRTASFIVITFLALFVIFLFVLYPGQLREEDELEFDKKKGMNDSIDSASDKDKRYNRLFFEKSPYLLQHAHNPVDWFPWGDEAFGKAKEEDKPIFLSIGYSSCHWCQVMEAESFEDEEVAGFLNQHFVAIKVDREERPDIDNVYMTVCQSMTGSGGWPLTIIMTPEKKPFFAGTYFPKQAMFDRPGLMEVLSQIVALWENQRDKLVGVGDQITDMLRTLSSSAQAGSLTVGNMEETFLLLQSSFDQRYGGFGQAPKFPSTHNLSFLLRWWKRTGEEKALAMVEKTLDAMWRGGVYDHLGFGFCRYSTDAFWLVPHFEKMLYDQATLAIAYIEAYQATGKKQYAKVAKQIFTYVLRDMTSPEGGFYSSENADSEGEEGKFYVWSEKEIKDILGEKEGNLVCRFYSVTERGNFEGGRNILHVARTIDEFSREEGTELERIKEILGKSREKLFRVRKQRVHPSKDDKVLTDWNGLMIAALAKGAQALDEPKYAEAASNAVDFLLNNLRRSDGRLLHRYREGEAVIPGYLDDYAFLIWGLLELYQTTFQIRYLKEALNLTNQMIEIFWDEQNGGFFFTGQDTEEVLARTRQVHDGAIPSGNSVALLNLLRLGRMTANQEFEKKADAAMQSIGGQVNRSPTGFTQLLVGLDFALGATREMVIAGEVKEKKTKEMLRAVYQCFLPRKVLLLHPDGEDGKAIEQIAPFVKDQGKVDGKATAYICENYACKLPTTDIEHMIALIESD